MKARLSIAVVLLGWGISHAAPDRASEAGRLIQEGNFGAAREVIEQALKTEPRAGVLWNLLGIINASQGKAPEAEKAFREAVRLDPSLESGWLNLGRVYQMSATDRNALDKGIAAYRNVLRLNGGNAEAHHQLAVLLYGRGEFRESLAQLNALPDSDRVRRAALVIRCADEAALGQDAAANKTVTLLLRDSELAEEDVLSILPGIIERNERIALRLLQGLDARGLAKTESLLLLAGILERRGEYAGARSAYDRAVKANTVSADGLLNLARVAWKQRDYEGTLSYLAHARDLAPLNAGIHFFFGLTCNELNLPVEAKKSLQKALELAPENPYYNYAMGAVGMQWAEKEQALPYLKKFAAMRPEDARGRLALASVYFGLLDYDRARAELEAARKDEATEAGAEYLLGRIAVEQEDFEGAIQHFRKVLRLEPKSAEARAELGSALLGQGDPEGAQRETELALRQEPENYQANRTLMKIYKTTKDPRFKEQTERLQKLAEQRDAKVPLLQRTIEVRPW